MDDLKVTETFKPLQHTCPKTEYKDGRPISTSSHYEGLKPKYPSYQHLTILVHFLSMNMEEVGFMTCKAIDRLWPQFCGTVISYRNHFTVSLPTCVFLVVSALITKQSLSPDLSTGP